MLLIRLRRVVFFDLGVVLRRFVAIVHKGKHPRLISMGQEFN